MTMTENLCGTCGRRIFDDLHHCATEVWTGTVEAHGVLPLSETLKRWGHGQVRVRRGVSIDGIPYANLTAENCDGEDAFSITLRGEQMRHLRDELDAIVKHYGWS